MIDPNIALQYRGIQINDPLETAGRAMSLRNMAAQNQLMQAHADEFQQKGEINNLRRMAVANSGGDPERLKANFISAGLYDDAAAVDKSQLESQKAQGELASQKAGLADKFLGIRTKAAQFAYAGGTPQHAAQAAQLLEQSGDQEGAQYITQALQQHPDATPDQVRRFFAPHLAAGQTPSDLLNPKYQDVGGQLIDLNPNTRSAAINKTQTPESIASNQIAREGHAIQREGQNIQIRGQDLTNDRAIEKNKIDSANGPKLTEIQSKAQLYGTRAQAAHNILIGLEGKYSPLAVNAKMAASDTPLIGGVGGLIGNSLLSESGQKAEQAQRDFVNAILRQESGAVISEPEFKNAQKQYFPQPGDTKGTLKQKTENRARAIKALDVMSGPAGGFSKQAPSTGGVKFLGFE